MQYRILPYTEKYRQDFYNINIDWLKEYFYVEPIDQEILNNPEKNIIERGGFVFMAVEKHDVIGTYALMPTTDDNVFEFTKMSISKTYRGKGIGHILMDHALEFSKKHRWEKLILYSNRKLENAIHIYKKYGFVEIPVELNSPYKRSDIKMELTL